MEQELEHLSSNNILSEYKKIKGIETALIGMMEKVDGRDGDIKDAWKWNKKIVWEYQAIKKKALKWK